MAHRFGSSDVRDELEHILAQPFLDDPLRRLLSYLADQRLAGQVHTTLEIAMEVFGRGADCDVRQDPVVPIQMARLHAKLENYYQQSSRPIQFVIDLEPQPCLDFQTGSRRLNPSGRPPVAQQF